MESDVMPFAVRGTGPTVPGKPRAGHCPTENRLVAFVEGSRREPQGAGLEIHLAKCGDCRDLVFALSGKETSPQEVAAIGRYRILGKIGEGGMGEVYEAEERGTIRRRVALKIVKLGMDTKQIVARFDAERQALALMSHPYVAKVFEAGATRRGRPFFAMELVRGLPITDHADQQRLTIRSRLELFIRVCEGVQHAHEKTIVHRDLKPSNIICTMLDGRSHPKIIDFGIAKAIALPLTPMTLFTDHGVLIGTPAYMSPEQAGGGGRELDTRSDVYSLGVILYELLVGALPTEVEDIRTSRRDEVLRRIREAVPPTPSTRLGRLGESLAAAAKARRTDPRSLERRLRGDLDWIVMKALEKDRDRRFRSPHELATDLRHYLENRPVSARPPRVTYRLRKFVRRNRALAVAVMAAVMLVLAFGGALVVQAGRVADERDRANAEAARASVEAQSATRVAAFLVDIFSVADPTKPKESVSARELLDEGAKGIDDLASEPELQIKLLETMSTVYLRLGLFEDAEALAVKAQAAAERVHGSASAAALRAGKERCESLLGRGKYEEVAKIYAARLSRQRHLLGDSDPATLGSLSCVMKAHLMRGRFDDAEPLALEIVDRRQRLFGSRDEAAIRARINLGAVYLSAKDYDRAEDVISTTLDVARDALGQEHRHTLGLMTNLGMLLLHKGELERAEGLYREAIPSMERIFGADHPTTLNCKEHLATLLLESGRPKDAVAAQRELVASTRTVLGVEHPTTANSLFNLAIMLRTIGRLDQALESFEEADAIFLATLGPQHRRSRLNVRKWAELLRKVGREAEAARLERRSATSAESDAIF